MTANLTEESFDKEDKAKIDLIQTEIINKQFSVENFHSFLQKTKGKDTIILSDLTIEEIQTLISQFKKNGGLDIENGGMASLPALSTKLQLNDSIGCYENDNDDYISTNKQSKGILSDYQHLTIIISKYYSLINT